MLMLDKQQGLPWVCPSATLMELSHKYTGTPSLWAPIKDLPDRISLYSHCEVIITPFLSVP